MFRSVQIASIALGLLVGSHVFAQAPAAAPAGSTGQCRDGSYWTGATKKGACRGHKGVQDWYGAAGQTAGQANSGALATPAPSAGAVTSAAPSAAAPAEAPKSTRKSSAPASMPAPGGGTGQVWVNTSSKVYHCQSDRWYGKTKSGAYMSEADAVAKGNRPDHGKPCK